jgi:hypothetical protein
MFAQNGERNLLGDENRGDREPLSLGGWCQVRVSHGQPATPVSECSVPVAELCANDLDTRLGAVCAESLSPGEGHEQLAA